MRLVWVVIPLVLFSIVGIQESFEAFFQSPKYQLESGIAPEDIICREDLILVLRINGNPVCVTERTAERISERLDWKIIQKNVTEEISITKSQPQEQNNTFPGSNGKIVFISDRDGNWEIYTMNADGSEQTRLTINNSDDQFPSWSPDGTKIVFVSDRHGYLEIYTMNADGSGQTRLTTNPTNDKNPDW